MKVDPNDFLLVHGIHQLHGAVRILLGVVMNRILDGGLLVLCNMLCVFLSHLQHFDLLFMFTLKVHLLLQEVLVLSNQQRIELLQSGLGVGIDLVELSLRVCQLLLIRYYAYMLTRCSSSASSTLVFPHHPPTTTTDLRSPSTSSTVTVKHKSNNT